VNNITLLVAMAVAALSGYFVGSYSGRDAKEALATAQIAARHAQDEHENTVKLLNERIGKLDSEYAEEKKDNTAHFRKQQQKWADLLASRDRRIVELSGMNNATAAEISRLRTSLQDMPLSAERKQTEQRIADLEKAFTAQQTQIAGLECSKIPVANEMLSKLKGDAL